MKLSIVIPVYNTEEYLSACLESVISPCESDYEIIVVNDGSTDKSLDIANRYTAKHPQLIRVITTVNGGLGAARNVGINAAHGEFILFLDSDDSLAPGALSEIMETLNESFDICIFDFRQVNTDGAPIGIIKGSEKTGQLSLQDYPELLFQPPAACNKIIRRTLFTQHNIYFPGRVWFEDLRTIPKLYIHADKILAVDKQWYLYLMRPGSITNSKNTGRNLEIIEAVDEILGFYRRNGCYEQYRSQLEYMAFYNQFLTSCTRVNLAQWNTPVQDQLIADFLRKFPTYRDNAYIKSMPGKYRLLEKLLRRKQWLAVHIVMKANSILKNKKA